MRTYKIPVWIQTPSQKYLIDLDLVYFLHVYINVNIKLCLNDDETDFKHFKKNIANYNKEVYLMHWRHFPL